MNKELSRLYQRICDYSPNDPQSQLKFTPRLARENGWTLDYAGRVVEEYKRFMFLAVAAGHPVTPSEQIDQAWHLHLVYTHSYWQEFCGQVLGKQVHHGPTKGGSSEHAKYCDWYECTKASYRRLLGDKPPDDIWPDVRIRFGEDLQWVRANRRRNWIIPKPSAKRILLAALGTLVLLATLVLMFRGLAQDLPAESSKRLWENGFVLTSTEKRNDWNQYAAFAGQATHQRQDADHDHPSSALRKYDTRWQSLNHAQNRKVTSVEPFVYVTIGVCVVLAIIWQIMFGNKCSSCGRSHAMEKTRSGSTEGFRPSRLCPRITPERQGEGLMRGRRRRGSANSMWTWNGPNWHVKNLTSTFQMP